MLNKYLQVIITIGFCGEGKRVGANRKSEGAEKI